MISLHYGHNARGELCPCAFVLSKTGRGRKPIDLLVDTDWDFPGLASCFGYQPCRLCDATDGTIDCEHARASDMIARAFDWLYKRKDRRFRESGLVGRQLDYYFYFLREDG